MSRASASPLYMRGPGVPVAKRQSQLVGNVDLAPTILDIANATPGRVQDGRSLFGLMSDRTREFGREFVLENGRGVNSVPQYRALRNNRFLFVRHDSTGEHELYDLRKDPFELKNLEDSDRYAAIRSAARQAPALTPALPRARLLQEQAVGEGRRCARSSRSARRRSAARARTRPACRATCACRCSAARAAAWSRCATRPPASAWAPRAGARSGIQVKRTQAARGAQAHRAGADHDDRRPDRDRGPQAHHVPEGE